MPEINCPHCDAGYSKTYDALANHINQLVWDRAVQSDDQYAKVTEFLCGRDGRRPFGHDSGDAYKAVMKLGELAGLPPNWSACPYCLGEGTTTAPEVAPKTTSPTP